MKRNLAFKMSLCFVLLTIAVLGLVNTLGARQIHNYVLTNKQETLYKEASLISTEYMNNFYHNNISTSSLSGILEAVDQFINAHIWIVNSNGVVIVDTSDWAPATLGKNINTYSSSFLEHTTVENTTIEGLLPEKCLAVIYPIPYSYKLRSYIVMLLPYAQIRDECMAYTDILTVCSLVFLAIICALFVYLYFMTARPLHKIRKAAMEYSKGNFKYEIQLRGKDEFHDVATALNYMGKELSSLDEYQKKFIANISHDFRSPLTSIKGYAEAIQDGTIPYEIQNKYLDIIVFESERLNKLTNNLLELNNFDNNRNLLDISSFDINQIIKKTCTSFEGICTKKKIQFNLVFSDKELFVAADMGKIQQVLYNLIDNAIKFSHPNSIIRVSSTQKNDKAFISVRDNGCGIPKASINKIWERFFKQDTSRGKDKKGTGLGLSITKEIINAHNENIDVISTEGVGSEFTFSLSLAE